MPLTPYTASRLRREQRHMRLLKLGYRDYPHYLRSADWAAKRHEYQVSGLPQDCFCGETEGIQLHHMTYERVGAEQLTDLTPVCPPCHAMIHTLADRGEIGLDFTGFVNEQRAAQRRAEVKAIQLERKVDWAHGLAHLEDVKRMAQGLYAYSKPLTPSRFRKSIDRDIWLILSKFKSLETKLDRVQSKHV